MNLKSAIRYLALMSGQNQPILLKNLNGPIEEEHIIQIKLLTSLDLIDLLYMQKYIDGQKDCYLGLVDEFVLDSVTLGLYGFITVTQFKILILTTKGDHEDNIRHLLMALYEAYKQECFSPFSNAQPFEGKMSLKFEKRVEAILDNVQ